MNQLKRHDFAVALRQSVWVILLGFIVFTALIPLSTVVVSEASIFNINYTHEQLKFQFYAPSLSLIVNAACVVLGAAAALSQFRFLFEKRSTTAFFSLALPRISLYVSRWFAGSLGVVVVIALPFIISLVANITALGLYRGELAQFTYVVAGYIAVALGSFSLTSVAAMRAGTAYEAGLFSVALISIVSAILGGGGLLAQHLLVGNAAGAVMYGQTTPLMAAPIDAFSWFNPVLFFAEEGATHQFFLAVHPVYDPIPGNTFLVVAWLVFALIIACGGCALFVCRAGEHAGIAGASPICTALSAMICSFALAAVLFDTLADVDRGVALVASCVVFAVLSFVFMKGSLRGFATRRMVAVALLSQVLFVSGVALVLSLGGLGFSAYVPPVSQVVSVEASYVGTPAYAPKTSSGVSSGNSYYCASTREFSSAESINTLRDAHQQLITAAHYSQKTSYRNFSDSVVPYDIVLRYKLVDGSEVVRYFNQAPIAVLETMLTLDSDEHLRDIEYATITGDVSLLTDAESATIAASSVAQAYAQGEVFVADGALNRIVSLTLSSGQRDALREAIATDWVQLNPSQRYASNQPPMAVVMFSTAPTIDQASFAYSFNNSCSYIDASWTNTCEWLQREGVLDALDGGLADASVFERLTFQPDNPFVSMNKVTRPVSRYFMAYRTDSTGHFWIMQDFGSLQETSDPAQIAEITPSLKTACFMGGGFFVQAKLRGIEAYSYFYLPAQEAPDWVIGAIQ